MGIFDFSFALAIRATTDTTGRLSRKDMEREVASGMLVTRLAESGTHWQRNRFVRLVWPVYPRNTTGLGQVFLTNWQENARRFVPIVDFLPTPYLIPPFTVVFNY